MSVNTSEIAHEVSETATHAVEHAGFLSLSDTHTWVLFSFIIFVVVMWVKARKIACKLLDDRTERIRQELEEAENLRKEAQKLLEEYKDARQKASAEANRIIEDAKKYALSLTEKAEIDARHLAEKRENSLRSRLNKAENEAIKKINTKIVDIATHAANEILEAKLKDKDDFLDKSIESIPNKF